MDGIRGLLENSLGLQRDAFEERLRLILRKTGTSVGKIQKILHILLPGEVPRVCDN